MKRFFKISLLAGVLAFIGGGAAVSKYPERGYRGFLDWDMHFGTRKVHYFMGDNLAGDYWWEERTKGYMIYGLSSSHGYQFNPHFFLGAGIILQKGAGEVEHRLVTPLFLQGRTDWTFGKVPLYLDLRLGGTFFPRQMEKGEDKFFVAPTVGYHLDWGRRVSANFGLGIYFHVCDDSSMRTHFTWMPRPAVRLGIEF